jgi:hypothetical protein
VVRYGGTVVRRLAGEDAAPADADIFAYARVRQDAAALARSDAARAADNRRLRAVEEGVLHVRHIERALAAGVSPAQPRRLAALLALALQVLVRGEESGARRLEREVALVIDDAGQTARARCVPMHVLAVGQAGVAGGERPALVGAQEPV